MTPSSSEPGRATSHIKLLVPLRCRHGAYFLLCAAYRPQCLHAVRCGGWVAPVTLPGVFVHASGRVFCSLSSLMRSLDFVNATSAFPRTIYIRCDFKPQLCEHMAA
eukprot:TRINITY_DN19171_c0_g1_i15.p2 TRINITY_DN19171_c0_g1~~TRINITY_DN19171_c0_g1_i15.p2  ORF type:complete len:106 (-),score=2.23 TRINITY_DN19171_c0_g1_i15:37-354(-)